MVPTLLLWTRYKRHLWVVGVGLMLTVCALSVLRRHAGNGSAFRALLSSRPFDPADYRAQCHRNQLDSVDCQPLEKGDWSLKLITSKDSTSCPRKLQKSSVSNNRTWLLSPPGSGNTWTRHLLQQLTGLYTGSLYHDDILQENGFPYEGHTRQVVAIKTHSLWAIGAHTDIEINRKTDRLIVLIRNPFHSLMSEYKGSKMNLKHIGNAPISSDSKMWRTFLNKHTPSWYKNTFLNVKSDLEKIIVYYEDLRSDLLPQLIRLANFISDKILQGFSFCCTLKVSEGTQHRKASNQTAEDAYSTEDKMAINAMLAELASSIQTDYPDVAKRLLSYIKPVYASGDDEGSHQFLKPRM